MEQVVVQALRGLNYPAWTLDLTVLEDSVRRLPRRVTQLVVWWLRVGGHRGTRRTWTEDIRQV